MISVNLRARKIGAVFLAGREELLRPDGNGHDERRDEWAILNLRLLKPR